MFRHLKLEIVLAIPVSKELKIEANNPAVQGLTLILLCCHLTLTVRG